MLDFIKETIKESFQSSVAKPRASRSHANLLDGGRQDLVKHGAPFNQARPKDKSNAFPAEKTIDDKKQIYESIYKTYILETRL